MFDPNQFRPARLVGRFAAQLGEPVPGVERGVAQVNYYLRPDHSLQIQDDCPAH